MKKSHSWSCETRSIPSSKTMNSVSVAPCLISAPKASKDLDLLAGCTPQGPWTIRAWISWMPFLQIISNRCTKRGLFYRLKGLHQKTSSILSFPPMYTHSSCTKSQSGTHLSAPKLIRVAHQGAQMEARTLSLVTKRITTQGPLGGKTRPRSLKSPKNAGTHRHVWAHQTSRRVIFLSSMYHSLLDQL